jgi:hypothetical protein
MEVLLLALVRIQYYKSDEHNINTSKYVYFNFQYVASTTLMTVTIGELQLPVLNRKSLVIWFLISTPQMTKGAAYVIYTGEHIREELRK